MRQNVSLIKGVVKDIGSGHGKGIHSRGGKSSRSLVLRTYVVGGIGDTHRLMGEDGASFPEGM